MVATRPNFLFLITDQHRFDYLGCYGHPVLETPHIDSIAARGTPRGNREGATAEKNATPARFRRQEG